MIRLFVVLYLKGNIFNKLLEIIIYKGLTFSITTLEENIVGTKVVDSTQEQGLESDIVMRNIMDFGRDY